MKSGTFYHLHINNNSYSYGINFLLFLRIVPTSIALFDSNLDASNMLLKELSVIMIHFLPKTQETSNSVKIYVQAYEHRLNLKAPEHT
ncbi:hypothetical protein V1478_013716 [Vespula squamosa]|uniref:Uncharacterized protein n=1 Tax=Vespula squamosa TaxID=30214 RepID=A0ABD2A604_VESSQ